jgi:hypothetical protein
MPFRKRMNAIDNCADQLKAVDEYFEWLATVTQTIGAADQRTIDNTPPLFREAA